MRPVKQLGVVTTHSLLFFAPAASTAVGACLLITHVTRFGFMFISAAMLVYAYPVLAERGVGLFYRRRLLAVALPYVTWTVVYFVFESLPLHGVPGSFRPTGGISPSLAVSAERLGYLLLTGYYQLYYLVVLMEFYLLYPVFLWMIRVTARHHWALVAASLALQLLLVSLEHWRLVPGWLLGRDATREVWYYQLYLITGGVMAWHYQEIHDWLVGHVRLILSSCVISAAVAETWFTLGSLHVFPILAGGEANEPFQPIVVPLYLAIIAALYLLGVAMADHRLATWMKKAVASGVDNSYGIYLSQVLFISLLSVLSWQRLNHILPWPIVVGGAVLIVFVAATGLTAVLARLPFARATAGRPRQPLPRWLVHPLDRP